MSNHRIPEGFLLGASTSSYQIEGSRDADGAGESIWDEFCRRPGAVDRGEDGAQACGSYAQPERDVAHLAQLGLNAYNFSTGWNRVMPNGTGAPNSAALDHYERFVDQLLAAEIAPVLTLNHWDMPQALMKLRGKFDATEPGRKRGGADPIPARGGWMSRDCIDAFAEYTAAVAGRLGDRIAYWVPQSEPWIVQLLGYHLGLHAPGIADLARSVVAGHHVMLSQGVAADVLHSMLPNAQVGASPNLLPCIPATDSPADAAAAWASDGYCNRWILDPLFGRGYPADMRALWEAVLRRQGVPFTLDDVILPGDEDAIGGRLDFLGVNFYERRICAAVPVGDDGLPTDERDFPWKLLDPPASSARTDLGWEVTPNTLTDLLKRVHNEYDAPRIIITENGAAYYDEPGPDGRVRDTRRIDYLRAHLAAVLDARAAGVRVEGYLTWSLLDNFEWAMGYKPRFGLVHVDYATGKRTVKDSGRFIAEVTHTRSLPDVGWRPAD